MTESRFVPTRAGIIGLWDYADEEFVFADGWLVLRGPNGSGKTKALELLFPFLLDGNISPRRLNPFASQDRTMKSNLLFGGKENGLGYAWMEFSDGTRHVTIGIGLRVNKHQDRPKRWHFVVEGRVGVDFGLIAPDDRVCNRKEMIAQLPEGAVVDDQREYRNRVNAALFGLEPERYEQMLELILTLRRPQLAKELNPETLSDTLGEGLRPIDDRLIVDAAKSFEDMEAVAKALGSLRAADEQVSDFLTRYTTYVRAHAKLAVEGVDGRLAAVEAALEAEADAERVAKAAAEELERLSGVAESAAEHLSELEGSLQGLRDSDAYRDRLELEELRRSAASAETQAQVLAEEARTRAEELEEAREEAGELAEQAETAATAVELQSAKTAGFAERGGIDWTFTDDTERLRRGATAACEQRGNDIRNVTEAGEALDAAAVQRETAEKRAETAESNLEAAAAELAAANRAVDTERESLERALEEWAREYRDALKTDLRGEALAWAAEADAETAAHLRERATERTQAARSAIGRRTHGLQSQLDGVRSAIDAKQSEWERIRGEHDDAPDAPTWRDRGRGERAGAPLWKRVRFKGTVREREAASIEAALEAAGILDAWIGDLDDASDQTLRPLPNGSRPTGTALADFLECEDDADSAAVRPILASIAVRHPSDDDGAAYSIVDLDGRFAHGAVIGRVRKTAPEFIGATARRRRRERRMRELETEIEALRGEAGELQDAVTECESELRALDEALRAMPRAVDLVRTFNNVAGRELVRAERKGDLDSAAAALEQAIARQHGAAQRLQETERRHELPRGDLESVRRAVADFEGSVRDLLFATQTRSGVQERLGQQQTRVAHLVPSVASMDTKAKEAQVEHRRLRSRLYSIEQSLDADAATVFEQIAELDGRIKQAKREVQEAERRREDASRAESRAIAEAEAAGGRTVDAVSEARAASFALRPFCDDDLLGILGSPTGHRWPGTDTAPGQTVLPEAVAALLADLRSATSDVQATENSAKAATTIVTTRLQEIMAQLPATGLDHHLRWDNSSGITTVEVDTDEGRQAIGRYGHWLHEQREEQELLLTEKEQHVLEDALLTSLTGQIHQRVIESRDLVEQMDLAMRERRTSSGLRLGVSWLLKDFDPAERELFSLFNAAPAKLSTMMPQIRKYFADRIKQERARRGPETTYRDLLAEILDYRKWRKFEFTLLRADGQRQRLTKRVHSQLSGGEQSVALHLPLFAAANAVFGSAAEHAPRMVGLDEAFAGVDEKGRGELMSLASEFDLQMIMTGFDLWATFPEVAGAAHYSMSHDGTTATVSAMLMVWNGAEDTEAHDYDGSLAAALGSPGTRMAPSGD
ncbi:TIGR02680 family protein [Glycomyces salinus]|uniref:TIGR02680 family protein n=1 Tax=Glycomyces salinus TaxID=980294 RepID=UPI0018EC1C94|nr:TIGR02680 family protein [Glycomyces salinus]